MFLDSALALIERYWTPVRGQTFLELGCGPMKIGTALAERGVDAVGLDFSSMALLVARERLRARGLPVRLVLGDVRATPFRDGAFDAVFGGGTIEHVRELDVVLQELRRIMRPGGVVINTVPYLSLGALTYRQLWGNIPAVAGAPARCRGRPPPAPARPPPAVRVRALVPDVDAEACVPRGGLRRRHDPPLRRAARLRVSAGQHPAGGATARPPASLLADDRRRRPKRRG